MRCRGLLHVEDGPVKILADGVVRPGDDLDLLLVLDEGKSVICCSTQAGDCSAH